MKKYHSEPGSTKNRDQKIDEHFDTNETPALIPADLEENNNILSHVADKTYFFEDPRHLRADILVYRKIIESGERPVSFLMQLAEDTHTMIKGMDKDTHPTKFMRLTKLYIDLIEKIEERITGGSGDDAVAVNLKRFEHAESIKVALLIKMKGA